MSAALALDPRHTTQDSALFTLVETIESLSAARTVEQIAEVIRSSARRITGADGVAFVLRDNDQCWYLDEDAIGPLWKGRRFPLTACISGWAMLNRETAVIPDIYADDRIPHDAYRPTFVKSLVMTPVRPDDPIAAIGAYWATRRDPTPEEVVKLQVMARATAAALESARMYGQLSETLQRREFLLRELDHRCKNLLAIVQSIAHQTLRTAASPHAFSEAFEARIDALSQAHEFLTRENWGRAQLSDILALALEPFGGLNRGRMSASGPRIDLGPESAVALHMVFHELASNAVKHGSLTAPNGRVQVDWSVDLAAEPPRLLLRWQETGGPRVAPPERSGFGRRLLERGLPRDLAGEAKLTFAPEGLRFDFSTALTDRIGVA